MRKIKALAIFNALSLIAQLAFGYMTNTQMIGQKNVSEVSATYETLFTPAGITFSIWGIIYITLGILCLYHIIIAYKHDRQHPANTELFQMNGLFILVNLASAAWLVAWTQERLLVSLLLIFLQLIGLILMHRRLGIYDPLKPSELKIATHFTLSVYLGWISIATIANTASYLSSTGWDGMGLSPIRWTVIMISAATVVSLYMIFFRRNFYYGLTVAWGLYGLILKRKSNIESYEPLINFAWAGIGIIFVCAVVQVVRNLGYKKKELFPVSQASLK